MCMSAPKLPAQVNEKAPNVDGGEMDQARRRAMRGFARNILTSPKGVQGGGDAPKTLLGS